MTKPKPVRNIDPNDLRRLLENYFFYAEENDVETDTDTDEELVNSILAFHNRTLKQAKEKKMGKKSNGMLTKEPKVKAPKKDKVKKSWKKIETCDQVATRLRDYIAKRKGVTGVLTEVAQSGPEGSRVVCLCLDNAQKFQITVTEITEYPKGI